MPRLPELLIILFVVVLVFGANKIPQLGDAIGRGIRNFKKASDDDAIDVTPKSSKEKDGPEKLSAGPEAQQSASPSSSADARRS